MIAQEPLHASLWRALRERCETKPGRKSRPTGADCRYPFCCCIEAKDAGQPAKVIEDGKHLVRIWRVA